MERKHPFINPVVKTLIYSDVVLQFGFGLMEPFLAIYFKEGLTGGSFFGIGIASAIFLGTKALFQPFIAKMNDRAPGFLYEKRSLLIGMLITSTIPFFYLAITHISQVYFLQLLYGIGSSFSYPAWTSLFTHHADRERVGYEWSVYDVSIGIFMALASLLGGFIVEQYSFKVIFVLVGIVSLLATFATFILLRKDFRGESS
ncbi:MAG: MFS transporter [Parcubacteria group bacterium]|nr:MFS transporter [Parcubacteria group bacterium]